MAPLLRHETESTVQTACPLDCPDSCTLQATVRDGRLVALDGGRDNPVTDGFICAKVRRFPDRVYGDARLQHPMLRSGSRGSGSFRRATWDEALDRIAHQLETARDEHGAESILPFCYGGSNGLLTQDVLDTLFFRRLGASRLARTVCAAPTGAANQFLYGKMPSVSYQDYPSAKLIVIWGMNPATSGIHALPYIRETQKAGARLVVVDPRTTTLARQADLHLAVRPGTDVAVALAIHNFLFQHGFADERFLAEHTVGADRLRQRASEWDIARAADVAGIEAAALERFAQWYASSSPALVRCGWGLERNRNGGNAAAAVLALPAVGGKFGVRGGGYAMSNSSAWNLTRPWLTEPEPATRLVNMNHLGRMLTEEVTPPVKALFVYNCNPAVTMPDQQRVLRGLQREDLFTVVFDQVFTDTALYADVVLPATTFVEHYDIARAYGPIALQLGRPVIDPVGEARSNNDVFGELASRMGLLTGDEPRGELEALLRVMDGLPPAIGGKLRDGQPPDAPWNGTPVQFVDVFPLTPDRKVHLFPEALEAEAPAGLYRYQADPATPQYPLALISPASDRTVSSTLGELPRPTVSLVMHPDDARARGLEEGDAVRVYNELGEVRCGLQVGPWVRSGTVMLPKGLWRKSTANGNTATTLAPDTLTDLGGGACFNDARVEVALVSRRTH
jgi:anaerobic selenocysteine-containing dehydrogenase